MKKNFYKVKIIMLSFLIVFSSIALNAQKGYKNDRLRIKFNPNQESKLSTMVAKKGADGVVRTGIASIDKLSSEYKVSKLQRVFPDAGKFEKKHRKYELHLWYELVVETKPDIKQASLEYKKLSEITIAEPIYDKTIEFTRHKSQKSSITTPVNDPRYNEQWHYNNTGQTGGTVDADIDLPEAWAIESGNPDVIVSVHDGGIDIDHVDIIGNMWVNPGEIAGNGIDDDGNGYVDDVHGYNFADGTSTIPADNHGTHVGGTVAAETNNGIGMAGVAGGSGNNDGVRLMSCTVFGTTPGGFPASYIYAADNGSVISQNSWGYTTPGVFEDALKDALDYFIAEAGKDENGIQTGPMDGGLVIFASGNDGANDLWYPGYYNKLMAVGGTDHNDNKYTSSNFGDWVELAAPAVNVKSTLPNDNYGLMSGTSMACPHASGVAALIVSKFKDDNITPQQVWDRMVNSTDPLTFEGSEGWGTGRLNAFKALAENDGQAPTAVNNLSSSVIDAVSVTLSWTAPADLPNNYPATYYDLRFSTTQITSENFNQAIAYEISSPLSPGSTESIKVDGLSPGTTYYLALKSSDYFGNTSGLSNVISITTENAPEIVITGNPSVDIDVLVNPIGIGEFNISNQGPAPLSFNIIPVYKGRVSVQSSLVYPGIGTPITNTPNSLGHAEFTISSSIKNNTVSQFAFESDVKNIISYDDGDETADGEISITAGGEPVEWAAATLFTVPDLGGEKFTLTHVSSFLKSDNATPKPIYITIVKGGENPDLGEPLVTQVFNYTNGAQYVTTALEMPLIFNAGDKFWIVNTYENPPVYLGYDDVPGGNRPNANLAYLNGTWADIQGQPDWDNYVWNMRAIESSLQDVSLNITSGTLTTGNSQNVEVSYDATNATKNGDYNFEIFVLNNDPINPVAKIESTVKVSGLPTPSLEIDPDTINSFIDVSINPVKTETLTITNSGSGELLYDFNTAIVNQKVSLPPADKNYPRGTSVKTTTSAPRLSSIPGKTVSPNLFGGSVAYAHEVYPGSSFVSIDTETPGEYNTSTPVAYTAYAGDFAKGDNKHMYIVDNESAELKKYNIETKNITIIGPTLKFTDFACDRSSGIMYAAMYNEPSSELYTVDLSSGTSTLIGTMGNGIMISIACDGDGNLWGLNLDNNIYSIDKTDGQMTLVGDAGFDANYAQSMAWDPVSNNIYMAAFNSLSDAGELRIVDTETGATQLIGVFPNNAEVAAFAFPGGGNGETDYISIEPISGTVAPNSSVNINVQIDATNLPNGEYNSSVNLYTNDKDNLSTIIPVNLEVTGQVGIINLSSIFMEFGAVFVNGEKEMPLYISNSGIGDLRVTEIISNNGLFTSDLQDTLILLKSDTSIVYVKFAPNFIGQFNGILNLKSDDPNKPEVQITVTGTAITPPVIALNPNEIEKTMDAGGIETEQFTIRNYGMYPLQFSFPSIALNQLLENPDVTLNNTSYIEGLKGQTSKDEPDKRVGHPVLLGAGGPDEFGYRWIDSKENGGPVYNWLDISTTGTEIIENSDDGSLEVNLPFGFKFYGVPQNKVLISSNGYLTFGTTGGDFSNDQIPGSSKPDNIIAPFWDDLRPSSRRGKIFYQSSAEKFVVQYHEVGNYPTSSTGTITFQVILYPNGNIEYVYHAFSLENNASATIGVENEDGTIGLQVAFNTEYIEAGMSVLIMPGRVPFDITASPVSGIVQPNSQQVIDVVLDATDLLEGSYINELLISSNDPLRPEEIFTTKLNVIGHPQIVVTPDSLFFDPIFQGTSAVAGLTIENTGSKDLTISNISPGDSSFSVNFTEAINLLPAGSAIIEVNFTAFQLGDVSGILSIESNDDFGNQSYPVFVQGTGIEPPAMTVSTNPDPYEVVMNSGNIDTTNVIIQNTGGSPLNYVLVKPYYTQKGNIVVNSEAPAPDLSSKSEPDTRVGSPVKSGKGGPDNSGYIWMDSDESAEVVYDWIEIKNIGTKLELGGDNGTMVSLPFSFPFYGQIFNEIQVASNGFLTFGSDLGSIGGFSNQDIPKNSAPNNLIAALWDDIEPQDGDGVYVHSTSEFIVIQYNEVPKFLGTGIATFQAILYPSGNIKFQYKNVSTYSGLDNCTVGIENTDGTDALPVVFNSTYLKNQLAVFIQSPFITGSVDANMTANIDLIIDASYIYDGVYESSLKVSGNDPANPFVEIPTKLTVIGTPEIALSTDFIEFNEIYYIDGAGNSDTQELIVTNNGSKTVQVDSLWFDPISSVFTHNQPGSFELSPMESKLVVLNFIPGSEGVFEAQLFIASNDPSNSLFTVGLEGSAIYPPIMSVISTDTLDLHLNSNGFASENTMVSNLGGSILNYTADIVYLPSAFSQSSEALPIYKHKELSSIVYRKSIPASNSAQYNSHIQKRTSFIDSIVYDPNRAPDDYYGYDGTAPYSAANKFTVTGSQFKLTHISNYYQNEGDNSPVVMEIFKGGSLPAEGLLVASQQLIHPEAANGANCLIELEKSLSFVQGDVFFVVFHYPETIKFPAAFNTNVSNVDGVSYWYDVNDNVWLPEDAGYVYKIRAFQAEGSSQESWLSISPELGQLNAGDSIEHQAMVYAEYTTGGHHYAKIMFNSNDPVTPTIEWPVKLYVNKLPVILQAPEDTLYVNENESLEIQIIAMDPENEGIGFELAENYPFTGFTTNNDTALLMYSPDFEQAGEHSFTVNVIDGRGEMVSVSWTVVVNNVNRSPVLITDIEDKLYFPTDPTGKINLSEYFADPDGDALTYEVGGSTDTSCILSIDRDMLFVKPYNLGLTVVTVTATDVEGESASASFNVRVRHTENHPPTVLESIDNLILFLTDPDVNIDLNDYFIDEDWDEINYSFAISGTASVNVSLANGLLSVSPWQPGMAVITIYANDNRGGITATTFGVLVVGDMNGIPFLASILNDRTYSLIDKDDIDLSQIFDDPDNDQLSYIAKVESGESVEVEVKDNILKVNPVDLGKSTIVVYASDNNSGIATTRFIANVTSATGIEDVDIASVKFSVYPNPVQYEATIEYAIQERGNVRIELVNLYGSTVEVFVNKKQGKGKYKLNHNVEKLSSGMYFYRMFIDGKQVKVNRMIVQ